MASVRGVSCFQANRYLTQRIHTSRPGEVSEVSLSNVGVLPLSIPLIIPLIINCYLNYGR